MLILLASLPLACAQAGEPVPPTPYDRVVELEIAVENPVPVEGRGAAVANEYRVDFDGTLHVWVQSELELFLRVEDGRSGELLAEGGAPGPRQTPYLQLAVKPGARLAILVAAAPGAAGELQLHLSAAPESAVTRAAAAAWRDAFDEIVRLGRARDMKGARRVLTEIAHELASCEGARHSEQIAEALEDVEDTAATLLDPSTGREALERVIAHRQRTRPADDLELLRARHYLCIDLHELGELRAAREHLERALEAHARILGSDHLEVVAVRSNLGRTVHALGDFAAAREHKEFVLEAYERLLPEGHPHLNAARDNLSVTIRAMGDLGGARALQETAVEAYARALPPDHPELQIARVNLANTLYDMGDYDASIEMHESVVASRRRMLPEDHRDLLTAQMNLAIAKGESGEREAARAMMEGVLETLMRTLPPTHPDVLRARKNLSVVLSQLGEHGDALALERDVLAEYRRTLPADHPELLALLYSHATTLIDAGEEPAARALMAPLASGMRSRILGSLALAPREALAVVRSEGSRLEMLLRLSEERDAQRQALAFELVETMRMVTGEAARSLAHATRDPELAPVVARAAKVRGELNDLVTGSARELPAGESLSAELTRLTRERDRLERQACRRLAERGVAMQPIRVETLAGALEGAAAVGYRRVRTRFADGQGRLTVGPEHLLAHVVTAGGALTRIDLGPALELEDLARDWRRAIGAPLSSPPAPGVPRGPHADLRGVSLPGDESGPDRAVGDALRARILDPILAVIGEGATRVFVCADDLVFLVPLDALPHDAAGSEYVGDRVRILDEVSFARLLNPVRPVPGAPSLLALGGVDYDADPDLTDDRPPWPAPTAPASASSTRRSATERFEPLPQTLPEATAVGHAFEAAFAVEPRLLARAQPTKAALFEEAPRARYLHLATHGWFAPDSLRTDEPDGTPRDFERLTIERQVIGLAPMTLCGLALVGANRGRDALGRATGLLTAEELCSLDLSACDLAVLSACETNVGIRRAGQGVQSLQAALHAAGARSAITSLWRVDDAATRRLMELFYTGLWEDGLGKADALWQAKTALREEGNAVRDWGGWVLTGAPE